ncbi:hypothetical protein IJI69_00280 [Candidatus Saccharibacteria bacterium]|nr:hypothetical protein [Candidatus Saccharibacteria bacterium]MBQ6127126.1 hypothetical protein [Candidatus Saccharibacteria bacterium]
MRQLKQKPVLNTAKSFEIACGIIVAIGFFLAIGAVGGCEHGTLSEGKAIMYSVIGLVMAAAGALGARWFSKFEDDDNEERGNTDE